MRDDFISKFAHNKTQIIERLDTQPVFRTSVAEFCATTGLKIAYVNGSLPRAYFLTSGGFPAGDLQWSMSGWNDRKMRYIYSGPFVHKEKASSSSSRNQRDSEKITGILSALKRNDRAQIPTDEKTFERYKAGIKFGFGSCMHNKSAPRISVDSEEAHALIEAFLHKSQVGAESMRSIFEAKYQHYLDKVEELREARANLTRFTEGAKIIGIIANTIPNEKSDAFDDDCFYAVGDAIFDEKAGKVTLQGPLERYESLKESPVAADAAIIRTYTGDKSWAAKDNELGIPMTDKFYDEIDVGVGYNTHETGIWVVIPKNGA
jgi:hypothetical protein